MRKWSKTVLTSQMICDVVTMVSARKCLLRNELQVGACSPNVDFSLSDKVVDKADLAALMAL